MPKRRKQLARADKAAAKAAYKIARAITTLNEEVAALPKVPLDHAIEQIGQWLFERHPEAYRLLDGRM